MQYLLYMLVFVCIYALLVASLDLLVGHLGLLSVAQAAFYGIGAYGAAFLSIQAGLGFMASTAGAMIVAAVVAVPIALPALRLHDDYFLVSTFGFQMIAVAVFANWSQVTGGHFGVGGIPAPALFGWQLASEESFLLVSASLVVLVFTGLNRIIKSPFGRVLHAVREDEVLAQALGKNTLRFKVTAFAFSAAIAALAGSLYAYFVRFVDPSSFTVMESILVISMVILGGAGRLSGALIGASTLVLLPELLRGIGVPSAAAGNVRQIIYASALLFALMFRPKGLLSGYSVDR